MIKMIVSDVDGTLLPHSQQKLDPLLFEQIRRLKEMGILFVAASGRQYANLYRLFGPVQDDIAYIAENGGLTVYRGEVLDRGAFPLSLTKEIAQAIYEDGTSEFSISGEQTYYIRPKSREFLWLMRDFMHNNITLIEDLDEIPEACLKVAVYDQEHLQEKVPYWVDRFSDRAAVVTSGNDWLDFIPKDQNKGNGVRCLQEKLKIAPEECMGFGDEYNDIEMLGAVRYSYAVSTAREKVKTISRYVTEKVTGVLEGLIESKGRMEDTL